MVLCGKDSVDRVEQPIKGCAVMSKRAVDVMSCEVNRLLILTASCIIPVSYCVPRKVMLNNYRFNVVLKGNLVKIFMFSQPDSVDNGIMFSDCLSAVFVCLHPDRSCYHIIS